MSGLPDPLRINLHEDAHVRAYSFAYVARAYAQANPAAMLADLAGAKGTTVNVAQVQSLLKNHQTSISAEQIWQWGAKSTALIRYSSGPVRFVGLSKFWAEPNTNRRLENPPVKLPPDVSQSEQTIKRFLESRNDSMLWLRHERYRIDYVAWRAYGMLVILSNLLDLDDCMGPDYLGILHSVLKIIATHELGIRDFIVQATKGPDD